MVWINVRMLITALELSWIAIRFSGRLCKKGLAEVFFKSEVRVQKRLIAFSVDLIAALNN